MLYDLGLPREDYPDEPRTLLRPDEVRILSRGSKVCFERGIGNALGFTDEQYQLAGATGVSHQDVWRARVVAKFKVPSHRQIAALADGSTVAAMMHAEGNRALVDHLLSHKARAMAFEYMTEDGSTYPLMAATGEISGKQAVTMAAYYLQSGHGSGRLFSATQTRRGARVTIIGFGNVGHAAAAAASSLGADVTVVHFRSRDSCNCGYPCMDVHDEKLPFLLSESDVIIGAIRISTFDTRAIVTEAIVKTMRRGSVIIDVTAGYGAGFIETSVETTTHENPTRIVHGVIHIKIRNLPRAVPIDCVQNVSRVFLPAVRALVANPEPEWVRAGLITLGGKIAHAEVGRHYRNKAVR